MLSQLFKGKITCNIIVYLSFVAGVGLVFFDPTRLAPFGQFLGDITPVIIGLMSAIGVGNGIRAFAKNTNQKVDE